MIAILASSLLFVACSGNVTEENGKDVTDTFLKSMSGSYGSPSPFPSSLSAPGDALTIDEKGLYEFRQYWFLKYPLETCKLTKGRVECATAMLETYCRLIDSGKIVKVIEFPTNPDQNPLTPTHEVRGLRSSSIYDSDSPYLVDGVVVPSAEAACLDMAAEKNRKSGQRFSRFSVVWPDDETLKFNHVTIPKVSGLTGLETTGTFSKINHDE